MRVLYVEPFEAGSHARFTKTLTEGIDAEWTKMTLPGRHWKWRMRGTAPWAMLAKDEELRGPFDVVWASSFVNLAEFVGLLPQLARVPRILHFHENQFAYPDGARSNAFDLDFGYVQMVSALAADQLVFNSAWNRDSFLEGARELLARMPDAVPPGWVERMRERATVLAIPMDLPDLEERALGDGDDVDRTRGPIVLWNHRWEHDKAPEVFFDALTRLADEEIPFRVAVCGQRFRKAPQSFDRAHTDLADRIVHWGTAESRAEYERLLSRAHVAISTARQEFFGLALLEATWFGAYPLAPARLSYPELLPPEHLYDEPDELATRLRTLCLEWTAGQRPLRADRRALVARHRTASILPDYARLLERTSSHAPH